jgi:biopolymer transport protein ExbB
MKFDYLPRLIAAALFFVCNFAWSLEAEQEKTMADILREIRSINEADADRYKTRETQFKQEAANQKALLRAAEDEVRRQERARNRLQKDFDNNEEILTGLESSLDKRVGDLGELFGVFRQTADDTQTMLFDSLITLEFPARRTKISKLAESDEVPTIAQMRALWTLLIEESALSGTISKFQASVVRPSGEKYDADVTRVGSFNVITEDRYLNYLAENDELVELPRQPAGAVRSSAADLHDADPGQEVGFFIDPSRGALLGLLVQSPSLGERVEQGKAVGYAIILLGIVGLIIVGQRLLTLTRIRSRINNQMKDLETPRPDNPLGRILISYIENKHLDLDTIKSRVEEVMFSDLAEIKKGLQLIKVFAAVAPLMGLLGTVIGMIGTFQAITLFGTGDPKLMAGGISQALVTTVLGLCAAIPLVLSHGLLSSQSTKLGKLIGEQFLSVVADKAQQEAIKEN